MLAIDPTARIAPSAVIGADVEVGPYCVIGPNVAIGDKCKLIAHVHIAGHTTIGSECQIYPFTSLGTPPQSVHYRGGPTRLTIGERCLIRESVTMNIGTEDGGGITTVGNDCFLMTGAHVGHDCQVGKNVILAGQVGVAGHCHIGDGVIVTAQSGTHGDIPAGSMVSGSPAFDHKQWLRCTAVFPKLPEIARASRTKAT